MWHKHAKKKLLKPPQHFPILGQLWHSWRTGTVWQNGSSKQYEIKVTSNRIWTCIPKLLVLNCDTKQQTKRWKKLLKFKKCRHVSVFVLDNLTFLFQIATCLPLYVYFLYIYLCILSLSPTYFRMSCCKHYTLIL